MSTRLRQHKRDALLEDVHEALYAEETAAELARARHLALACYDLYVPAEQRKVLKQVEPRFLVLWSAISPQVRKNSHDTEPLQLGIPRLERNWLNKVQLESPLPLDDHQFKVTSAALHREVKRFLAGAEKLKARKLQVLALVEPLINTSSTIESLRNKWPKDVPMPAGWASSLAEAPKTSNLPAVVLPRKLLREAFKPIAA